MGRGLPSTRLHGAIRMDVAGLKGVGVPATGMAVGVSIGLTGAAAEVRDARAARPVLGELRREVSRLESMARNAGESNLHWHTEVALTHLREARASLIVADAERASQRSGNRVLMGLGLGIAALSGVALLASRDS